MAVISGFPEYLPQGRMVEMRAMDILRETFELHGFASIHTRALEPLSELSRKGEITKEVYAVRRFHATEEGTDKLGLHFDLTIPFARYVLDNAGHLDFPFRRYQIQPAWRGERPQEGRYREFCQADIDIVDQSQLSFHHDIEVCLVMLDALSRLHDELSIPPVLMRINNRKLIQGFYSGMGIEDTLSTIQAIDKLPKVGPTATEEILLGQGLTRPQIKAAFALAKIESHSAAFVDAIHALGVESDLMEEGIEELSELFGALSQKYPENVVIDLKIARGLDYYTGSVFEVELQGNEGLGTISAGGRYDSLVSDGRHTYPGVGLAFGLTRVLAPLLSKGVLRASRPVPSAVLIAVDAEESRHQADEVASLLRARGIPCEVSPNAAKYGKQIKIAERRGIPYVWFGSVRGEVKNMQERTQGEADAHSWTPPESDLHPAIIAD